jgi:hypothetical protein
MRLTRFANVLGTVAVLAANANAALVPVTTASRPFDPGVLNQGWWLGDPGFNNTFNDGILTGNSSGQEHRSFYTFDLSSPQLVGQQVVSATLQMQRFTIVSDSPTETIGFFDVSTDAATLNSNTGANAGIFADLGTGNSYGSSPISPGDFFEILQFQINSTAVSDINASLGGYFSVGGRWLTITAADDFGFGGPSGDFAVRLALEVQPIPEPSIPALVTLVGAGFVWHRSRRRTSIAFRPGFTRRRLNPTETD